MTSFDDYLARIGRLFVEGVMADVHPGLLRRLGGSLALAGHDASWIRVEEDAALGFLDLRRSPEEMERIAHQRWAAHEREIRQIVAGGVRPTQALRRYLARYGAVPHTPETVDQMLRLSTGPAGTYSQWLYDIVDFRRRFQRAGAVMTNTFGALTAGAYLIATAEDWQNATPEEWDAAFAAGEVGVAVGELAGAVAGGVDQRHAMRSAGRSVADRSVSAETRSIEPRQRGTGAPARSPRVDRRPADSSRNVDASDVDAAIATIDTAIGPGAPAQVSAPRMTGRPRHRRGPMAGQLFASLDDLVATLSPNQLKAARRLIGRMPSRFRQTWERVNNDLTRDRNREVRRLWRVGRRDEARELARTNYNNYRSRFWAAVRDDGRLSVMLEAAGLVFAGGRGTAPGWRLPDGTVERLSLEHSSRVVDAPWLSTRGSGLRMVPSRENSNTLEFVRNNDPFQSADD